VVKESIGEGKTMNYLSCRTEVYINLTVIVFKDFRSGTTEAFIWSQNSNDTARYQEFVQHFLRDQPARVLGEVSNEFLLSGITSYVTGYQNAVTHNVPVRHSAFPLNHSASLVEYLCLFLGVLSLKKGIGVDIETRSLCDLPKRGLHNYAADPSTDMLCFCWGAHGNPPDTWTPNDHAAAERFNALAADPDVFFTAWNAQFEIENWKFQAYKHGLLELPENRWICTQGIAASRALPLALGKCAVALGMPQDKQKSTRGTRLINLLSKPIKGTTEFREDLELSAELYDYCVQDVVTESAIFLGLGYVHDKMEDLIQRLTWKVNKTGIPVDILSVTGILKRYKEFADHIDARTYDLTERRVKSPRQRAALIEELDAPLRDLKKETVERALNRKILSHRDRTLLEFRQGASSSSTSKYKKILELAGSDERVRGTLQYHGAATGRDGGRGIQPQNLPGGTPEDPCAEIKHLLHDHIDDNFNTRMSHLTRSMIKAPSGYKFLVSDYSQIEARGVPWLCKEEEVLSEVRKGVDPYKAAAAVMYEVTIDEVTKVQRKYGKIAVLACGYQGSHVSLTRFAEMYGLSTTRQEAAKIVDQFRARRPKLVAAWENFGKAAVHAYYNPLTPVQVPACRTAVFLFDGANLSMRLPSGRAIWYPQVSIGPATINYVDKIDGLRKSFQTEAVYHAKQVNNQWVRRDMSGGNFLQNWVQGACRDVMMWRTPALEKRGYHIIIRVHDEVVTLVPDTPEYTLEELNALLTVNPPWAEGLPLASDGYEAYRYKK
jgi:DNA polymerase